MNLTSLTTKDWHARAAGLRYETRHFIDGQYVDSVARGRFTVVNPATGAPLCEVSAGTAADIDLAVAAATAKSMSAAVPALTSHRGAPVAGFTTVKRPRATESTY